MEMNTSEQVKALEVKESRYSFARKHDSGKQGSKGVK